MVEVVEIVPVQDPELDPDSEFLLGRSKVMAPFSVPLLITRALSSPTASNLQPDPAMLRLIRFAQHVPPFEWPNDPRTAAWEHLLAELAPGEESDPVLGAARDLWNLLLAVARADRFNDGVFAGHGLALTRIANELRRRLLAGTLTVLIIHLGDP